MDLLNATHAAGTSNWEGITMNVNYNRLSRVVWISDERGNTVARAVTPHGERCIDAAGKLLTDNGFVRSGDYILAGSGSPVRSATVRAA